MLSQTLDCNEIETVKGELKIVGKGNCILIKNNTIQFYEDNNCVSSLNKDTIGNVYCKVIFVNSLFSVCTCLFFYFFNKVD